MAKQHNGLELGTFDGVEIRKNSIRIHFTYQMVRCKPTLKGIKPSKANRKFAEQKLATVKYEINNGSFNYAHHFPDCPKAKLFSPGRKRIYLETALDDWLAIKRGKVAPGTYRSYTNKAEKYVRPLGANNRVISDFTTTELELWIEEDLDHLTNKSINEILIIARGTFGNACRDLKIENPFDFIDNKVISQTDPDPFDMDEIERILNTKTRYTNEVNMAEAALGSGLSVSEYTVLAWEDIDQTDWTAKIRRVLVETGWKVPKTAKRERVVEFLDSGIEALKRQKELTFMLEPIEIEVLQRDNKTRIKETITPVFLNTNTGKIHRRSTLIRWMNDHLKRAKVRYRGPNNYRHSFASQMLTAHAPIEWLVYQMGHSNDRMIRQNYAKYIQKDAPRMAGVMSAKIRANTGKDLKQATK